MDTEHGSGIDEEQAWQAVLARDAREDGRLYYGVASTGVYCRPACPARRPRRSGVRFFATPEAAERAGFRACRRCRPKEAPASAALVRRVCAHLEARATDGAFGPATLAELARVTGTSAFHLQRVFTRATGISPREYAAALRSARFRERLAAGDAIADAVYAAGFGSPSRAYERAAAELGMTPAAWRRGGAGLRVRVACVDTPLGRLLVAATGRGLAAVRLGDDDAALRAELARELPHAAIGAEPDAALAAWTAAVVAHLAGERPLDALPLDVRATAFQRRVWQALRAIPCGEVRSYAEVAAAIGQPGAARAVARACAMNPVAVAIPCHRVVGADGAPRGYRWGTARQERLLAAEAAMRGAAANGDVQPDAEAGSAGSPAAPRAAGRDPRR